MARRERTAIAEPRGERPPASVAELEPRVAALTTELRERTGDLEESLEIQTATSDVLKVISQSGGELGPVLDTLLETGARLCRAEQAVFALKSPQDGLYRYATSFGYSVKFKDLLVRNPVSPGRGSLIGRTALEAQVVHIEDAVSDPEYSWAAALQHGRWRTGLGVPLLRDGVVIGILALTRRRIECFTGKQIDLVKTFADQAVIAIENTRLLTELREHGDELARRETELREQDERYGLVTQAVAEGIYDWDIARNALWVSPRLIEIFGWQAAGTDTGERPSQEWNARVHPEDFQTYRAALRAALKGETLRLHCEYRIRLSNGEYRWVEDSAVPVRDEKAWAVRLVGAVSDITERKQTERVLHERTSELEEALEYQTATSDMLRVISRSTFDLEPLLATVAETAARLCAGDMTLIYRRNGEAYELAASFGFSVEDQEFIDFIKHHAIPPSRGTLVGQTALEGEVVQIGDLGALPRPAWHQREVSGAEFAWVEALQRRRMRTMLGVPLLREGVPIGVITVARGIVRPFTPKQVALVTTFADQAVIAIENARLMTETQEALEQQTATAEVLQVINSSPGDLAPVFDAMLEKAMHLCEATFGHLATYDGKQFQTVAIRGVPARFAEFRRENQQVYGAGTGVARLLQGEKFVHFIDVADTDAYRSGDINQRAVVDLGGARSMLVVPLVKDEAMQGFITIYRQEVRPFSDKQIALLQNFAAQAVIAMENARLMNETREALERQTATAEILRVISSSPTDAQPTFDAIARAATTLSGAVLGGVFTFDGSLIHFVADYGWTPDEMAMIRSTFPIPPGRGSVAARAISTRAVAHIEDMSTDPEFAYPSLAQSGGHTVLSVPILRDGNPIGAINVQRRHVELFSDKQIDLLKTFADQAVIAIENVRLFNELSDRTGDLQESLEYQTATSDVLKVISRSTFDLQPVLDTMVETATRLCDAEMANLALREGELLRVAAAFGYSPEYEAWLKAIGPYRPEGRSVGSKAALEGHVVHVHDITTDPNYPSAPITLGKQRTSLGVPLLRRGETIGVFILARQRVEPFTERQIELVRTFADQAVIAIENTRLLTEQREALERQTATTEILRIISSSPTDVQPTFDAIAAKATTLCDAASGGVFRFDGSLIHFVAHYGWTPEELDAIQHVFPLAPGRDSVAGRAILTKAVAHTADLGTDPEFTHPSISATGLRAALSVPMLRDGNAIGTISVTRHDTQPFSEIQIELLKTFADQAVIAIENTRLFNELQDLTADLQESLEYQTATSEVLKVVSRSTFDLPAVLDTLLQTASRLCGNAEGGLAIRQGDAFRYVATVALEPEFDAALRERSLLPGRGSTVGRVAQEGEVVHIPDIAADPEYALPEVRDLGKIRTTLGVPLLRQGETIGVITLAHRHVELFTERQIALVSTFADQAVIAIENTRLLGELRERTGDLEESLEYQTATSDVLKVISRSTFDLKPVLDTLVTTAAQLCGAEMGHIAKRDGDVYRVASTFAFSPEWDVAVRKLTFEPGRGSVVGRAALTREAVQIADLAADPEYAVPGVITIGKMRTGLGVPLLREGEPIGVIYLARQRVEPFSERQIELVRTFADQAVIAIENARLMTETREALEQQTATAEILQVINSSPGDLTPVFEAMLEKALSLCGASLGTLYTYDGELMHVVAMRGAPPECAAHLTSGPHRPGAGALGRLVRAERVVQIHDVAVAEAYRSGNSLARALVDFGKVRTNLALPLHKDGALRGVIAIYRQEVRPFSDKQIALLQNFAEQAVIAIDNARLLNEIRRREAELRVTFDNMGDGVVMFDGELRLVAWNQNFQQILDFPDDFFVEPKIYADYIRYLAGRGEFGAVDPEAELQRYAANAARQSTVERTRPDGRVIEVRHNPVPGGGFVLIYSDVTERKRAEAEIHAARDAAESALRELKAAQASLIHAEKMASLGQLTAGIAHEIKNPLNFVNNFAGLSVELLDDLKAAAAPALAGLDNDSRTEFDEVIDMVTGNLTKIAEHGRRADGIVTSMLAHSRGTSGERQSTDVNALVEESLNLAYHGARAQDQSFNITLERNFDRAIAPIELVPQDMTRVFLNLFGNGFYAANKRRNQAADGGFKPTLTVTTRDLGEAIEIRVRDNGTGIPPEFRDKLFQPFFTTKPTGEGTGLGLSISYDIVTQEHGGTIEVDSELGAFTEFTIRLPRAGAIEIHNLQRE